MGGEYDADERQRARINHDALTVDSFKERFLKFKPLFSWVAALHWKGTGQTEIIQSHFINDCFKKDKVGL